MAAKAKAKAAPPSLQIQIEITNGAGAEGSDDDGAGFSYDDIMMLGRTGLGKSTVGNKLLGINPETRKPYKEETKIEQWGYDGDEEYFFETGDGKESVTKKCKVLSNGNIRIMDTRGFADSEMTQKYGVIQGNLQSFRWILQAQRANDMRFYRVLYFFPQRGPPPERADGTLQEEIKVMHGYFGQRIFDIMIIIVTNNKRPHFQRAGYSEEDIKEIQGLFLSAFEKIVVEGEKGVEVNIPARKCPPVVYIPFNEDYIEVFKIINGIQVISAEEYFSFSPEYPLDPEFRGEVGDSSQTTLKYGTPREEFKKALRQNRGRLLSFEDRCSKCAIKLVFERQASGEELPITVIYPNGDQDVYDSSYCHPLLLPKYTRVEKIFGGIAHIVTLGLGKLYEYATKNKSWPSFTSSDEVCIKCNKAPGSQSCHPVNQHFEIAGKMEKIDHKRELDTVELLDEETSQETTMQS